VVGWAGAPGVWGGTPDGGAVQVDPGYPVVFAVDPTLAFNA